MADLSMVQWLLLTIGGVAAVMVLIGLLDYFDDEGE
jgi:hypothetical protein